MCNPGLSSLSGLLRRSGCGCFTVAVFVTRSLSHGCPTSSDPCESSPRPFHLTYIHSRSWCCQAELLCSTHAPATMLRQPPRCTVSVQHPLPTCPAAEPNIFAAICELSCVLYDNPIITPGCAKRKTTHLTNTSAVALPSCQLLHQSAVLLAGDTLCLRLSSRDPSPISPCSTSASSSLCMSWHGACGGCCGGRHRQRGHRRL